MTYYLDSLNNSGFDPIPELQRDDADTTIFFLSANDIAYLAPVDDPLYSAHVQAPTTLDDPAESGAQTFYYRDQPVGVLGCTQQFQFCNPNLRGDTGCTPLSGYYSIFDNPNITDSLWETAAQNSSFEHFTWAIGVFGFASTNIDEVVASLGISALLARNSLGVGLQGPLPNNQWELEVEHWIQASMALVQRTLLEQATGPFTQDVYPWLVKPQNAEDEAQCQKQVSPLRTSL